jgi:hypothetical protein
MEQRQHSLPPNQVLMKTVLPGCIHNGRVWKLEELFSSKLGLVEGYVVVAPFGGGKSHIYIVVVVS